MTTETPPTEEISHNPEEIPSHPKPVERKSYKGIIIATSVVAACLVVFASVKILTNKNPDSDKNTNNSSPQQTVSTLDTNNLPKFIEANFVDMGAITQISKFRSLAGHDFSNGGETCRSMKHYFNQNIDPNYKPATFEGHSIPAPPDGITDINIFSPVTGTISQIVEEHMPIGKQFYIVPDSNKDYTIRLFHVFPLDTIASGQKVTAGQKLGVIAKGQGTDISVEYGLGTRNDQYISYFDVMPDSLFADFTAKGVATKSSLIISKADRDANSVACTLGGDQSFQLPANYDDKQDYVLLKGYVEPRRM